MSFGKAVNVRSFRHLIGPGSLESFALVSSSDYPSRLRGGKFVILDLRHPTMVIAGAFNPAIFTPEWIAAVLYQIPEGEDIDGVMLLDTESQQSRPYMKDVAVVAEPHRLSIFIDRWEAATIDLASFVASNLCNALPHTPVGGFGVNFRFFSPDFDENVASLLAQRDEPEKYGKIERAMSVATIVTDDKSKLNFARGFDDQNNFVATFNYHADTANLQSVGDLVAGRVEEKFADAVKILKESFYPDLGDIDFQNALNRNAKGQSDG